MDSIDKFLKLYSYKFNKGYPDMNDEQDILLLESILKKDFDIILEGTLDPSGWRKPISQGPNKGKDKRDVLRDKIRKEDEVEVETNEGEIINVKLDNSIKIPEDWNGSRINIGSGYTTSDIIKTEEFGGLENVTAKSEAIQAIAVAIRLKKSSDIEIEDINIENVGDVAEKGLTSIKDKNTKEDLVNWYQDPKNKGWATSTINTANAIANSPFIQGGQEYFTFWQDDFVDEIYKTFNLIKSKADKSNIISVVSDDKWNPSDMFVSTAEGYSKLRGILNQIDFENIQEYNGIINDLFCDGEVIGISLKKSQKGLPQIKEFNQEVCKARSSAGTIGDLKFKEYVISPGGGGIEIHVLDKNGDTLKLNLRNFSGTSGFSGEIKGTEAAGGKVGIAAINTYLEDKNFIPTSPLEVVKNLLPKTGEPTKAYMDKFKSLWDKHIGTNFNNWFNQAEDKHKTTRYFALHVIDALEKSLNKDKLLTDLFQYGGSSIKDISSTFAKSGK